MKGTVVLPPDGLSEGEVINRILAGEKQLFEWIVRRYNQRLFRIGMSLLKDETEVEDAMQATYVKAYEHLRQFERRSSAGTWLVRILLNECLAQRKRRQKLQTHHNTEEMETKPAIHTPSNILLNKELGKVLENALAQLPEKYRVVFVLREIEEMSTRETGDALGIEEPNVKVRLNRAKTMLRDNLNGYFKETAYPFHLTRCDLMVERVFRGIASLP
ncbi:MAG: sigma-70 family RNA polymerase sigma factor [Bacteroidota bacterium]|nr:sigma-70 family RNA polymerase sigma factor [Bacteroidota bacterium]MDP4214759.1 sigma-70 family RNA polymerase sigma factor [Bacteroidota bacterium]MDP4245673.1 sigma-70 family RNA polymerase sigma factor [Bacteroidota bacterium]MDP4253427.1 sigma-70 family RNA polymerase sigma factor [Bacteroidota bacterium]MDP4256862.1 sigma-70 family RNA polymerase sigma factor [Bacteroidota bacterium]